MTQSTIQQAKSIPADIKMLSWLKTTFPDCFIKGSDKLPLKIGILDDVLVYCAEFYPEQSQKLLKRALIMYTKSKQYLTALTAGKTRIDLHGKPCGIVTEEQQAHAEEQLKMRQQAMMAKSCIRIAFLD